MSSQPDQLYLLDAGDPTGSTEDRSSATDLEPRFTAELGIYRCAWGSPTFVAFSFDMVRSESRSGDLTAEVTVVSTAPGIGRVLHQARVNLSGTRARRDFAQYLESRTRGQVIDWPELVEQAVLCTIAAYRAGEPAILLRDAALPGPGRLLLPPLLLAGQPTILFGDGGSGKSYLALAASIAIQTGRRDLLGLEPQGRSRVGYLDWEWDAWEHRARASALVGEDIPDLVYVPCRLPLCEEVDRLRRIVAEHRLQYLVVDSVALACDGPPEASDVALRFMSALRRLQLGALCIAHVNRIGDKNKPFGSAYWHNSARATWYAERQQGLGSRFTVGLFNRKSNSGPLEVPLAFEFDFKRPGQLIRRTDLAEAPDLAAQVTVKVRMVEALRGGSRTLAELAQATGASLEAVRLAAGRGQGRLFIPVIGPDGVRRIGLMERRP